ncbi:DUF11 domain-containing protein [Methylotetracoccus oryzae]|uniref:DUF11 domain-containing protein n=1 Tax=Methylotetracoccus oryzae TaxID=1919059 RepID=UPI00111BCD5A|nr:DUF11 domain-containing protein [Methylotetracoccus oryzae]
MTGLSSDGRFVLLGVKVPSGDYPSDVFVYDRQTGQSTQISKGPGDNASNSYSGVGTISADGRFIAFLSNTGNLIPGDTSGSAFKLIMYDRQTNSLTRLDVDTEGAPANGFDASFISYPYARLSSDGRLAVFSSYATNLVKNDTNNTRDVFVRERVLDRTAIADIAVTQTASPSPFPPSSPITYTVTVVNNGPDAASEVTLVDGPLRGAATPSQGTCSNGAPLVCYLGFLDVGTSASVTLKLPPRSGGTTRIYNSVQVNAAPVDPNPRNNKTGLHVSAAP